MRIDLQPISPSQLLDILDTGSGRSLHARAIQILHAAAGDQRDWPHEPLGNVNDALLRFRELQFGTRLDFVDRCPHCGHGVEFHLDSTAFSNAQGVAKRSITLGDKEVIVRPYTPADFLQVDHSVEDDPESAARELLSSCIANTDTVDLSSLTAEDWSLVAGAIAEADPLSEILFDLECPDCGGKWESLFEPTSYLWRELVNLGERLLREIHMLARAYGWDEATCLRLTPERRGRYVQLIVEDSRPATSALAREGFA